MEDTMNVVPQVYLEPKIYVNLNSKFTREYFQVNKKTNLTQILILGPVAAHNQYLFGLKQSELIILPPSNV